MQQYGRSKKAILRFEEFIRLANLKTFDQKQATEFKAFIAEKNIAKATILSIMNNLKRFFAWLALQPGYKKAIRKTDIDYLNLSEKDIRAATAPADMPHPSLQMIKTIIVQMPHDMPIQKRDKALIAFTAITGTRDGVLVSLKLKHFDIDRMLVLQNSLEVSIKFSRRIDTFLFPMNDIF